MEAITELFGSDLTLIGAVLAGLALTSLGIVRDLSPLRLRLGLYVLRTGGGRVPPPIPLSRR